MSSSEIAVLVNLSITQYVVRHCCSTPQPGQVIVPAKQSAAAAAAAAATIGIYRAEGEPRRLLIKGFIRRERERGAGGTHGRRICVVRWGKQLPRHDDGLCLCCFLPPSRL